MKKYVIHGFINNKYSTVGEYNLDTPDVLKIFTETITPENLLQEIENSKLNAFNFENIEIRWSEESNSAAVNIENGYQISCYPEGKNPRDDFFVMQFNHFKKFLQEWTHLKEKRAPEIYFIQKDDGTIIVQETL